MNLREQIEPFYERYLRWQCRQIPDHIAIIMDGNRRYARMLGAGTITGHRAGAETTTRVLEWAQELGIRTITLYSFSTENFRRDREEVAYLFELFKEKFISILSDERVHKNHIRVQMIGDRSMVPADLLQTIEEAEAATRHYSRFFLNIALAYGGRNEMVHAARRVVEGVRDGQIDPASITPRTVEDYLYDGIHLPPVDLIVRTGNERRTSNFLPWMANGNECAVYFCAPYWPLFRKIDLLRAIRVYDQRLRSA
ncbi:polyprenyl diphosphate synthase [Methanofollis fontis]|uniref:Tritrans,polycis-undecaprenyl-diphosphate synthase (geranylgeranyl-diphosphate specific) n=1 Tax=Methanofollis fontis TaxID=2052832 RepID=A0A483CR61_9EURY|nr:polyprenyl diphosphate synthase [Methanofollis fontis]TAJ43430.1 di-trans,poly-cis-decaprenylcistransferase [Methanofollis fontis]